MFPSFLYPTRGHWFQKKSHCGAKKQQFPLLPSSLLIHIESQIPRPEVV